MLRTYIFVTTQFEGFHCWKDAPDYVSFLRSRHRHIFHVRIEKEVHGLDRQIEFITFKQQVETLIRAKFESFTFAFSCEQIAHILLDAFQASRVEVSEDGENGAVATSIT